MTQLSRALGLAGVSAGAVLASAGGAAASPVSQIVPIAVGSTEAALDPALDLRLDPLAGTGSDPLANGVQTQVADFRPIGTDVVTGPLTSGASARELPGEVVAGLLGGLPVTFPA